MARMRADTVVDPAAAGLSGPAARLIQENGLVAAAFHGPCRAGFLGRNASRRKERARLPDLRLRIIAH
jgi:hypothetical protein